MVKTMMDTAGQVAEATLLAAKGPWLATFNQQTARCVHRQILPMPELGKNNLGGMGCERSERIPRADNFVIRKGSTLARLACSLRPSSNAFLIKLLGTPHVGLTKYE